MVLIWAQHPTATRVAGYRQWERLGRQVVKGSKAIKIFGYSMRKVTEVDDDGEEETTRRPYFPVLNVFDIDQTELIDGHTDDSAISSPLAGADESDIFGRVADYLSTTGWTVERGDTAPAFGYTRTDGSHLIRVSDAVEPAQAAKTVIHEAAHALLHAEEGGDEYIAHRGLKETEAESVAYVMAGLLGLDTSDYSVGYIAGWSHGDLDLVRSSAANVLRTVDTLSKALIEQPELA